jgi:hypothetical protein
MSERPESPRTSTSPWRPQTRSATRPTTTSWLPILATWNSYPSAVQRATMQFAAMQARIEDLEDKLDAIKEDRQEEQLDHAITAEEREKRVDENRWLRSRLQEQQDFDPKWL